MQEKNFTALLNDAQKINSLNEPDFVKSKMENLSIKNRNDLVNKPVPDYLRLPSGSELEEMRQWVIDYKKTHSRASKREIRKVTQSHFNIKIYR